LAALDAAHEAMYRAYFKTERDKVAGHRDATEVRAGVLADVADAPVLPSRKRTVK
jgi:hypothetical protein